MRKLIINSTLVFSLFASLAGSIANAAVSQEEAAKLKGEFTPMGSERAGNKDGSIPSWDGGYTKSPQGYKSGDPRPDPFANEKPLASIDAKNMDQYGNKLTEGVKALMKKYPSYRIDVFPTHRTAMMPQWVYDNTYKNATRCKTKDGGLSLEGCYGGIPFPIPKSGNELIWNHVLSWRGQASSMLFRLFVSTSDGKSTVASDGLNEVQSPYWFKDGSLESFNGDYNDLMLVTYGPPFKAGESILLRDPVDFSKGRQAWQYLVGQRRTRKAPTVAYDTPDSVASGAFYFDEAFGFSGAQDRYDWKIVGKKEMYIPYNTNRTWLAKANEVLGPQHINPDYLRWELHRVWVVDATLAAGKRHAVPKRRYYLDEDTYNMVLSDMWDGQGQIWRVGYMLPMVMSDVPGTVSQTFGLYNLLANTYVLGNFPAEKPYQFKQMPPWKDTYFTPENLAAKGNR